MANLCTQMKYSEQKMKGAIKQVTKLDNNINQSNSANYTIAKMQPC